MADLRRRKPDDDTDKLSDDNDANASLPNNDSNVSDDEQTRHKPSSGLTTADSSDHVSMASKFVCKNLVEISIVWANVRYLLLSK